MENFLHQTKLYFGRPLCDVNDTVKINYLLLWASVEGQEISETFIFKIGEAKNVHNYIKCVKDYVSPQFNF